MGFENMAHVLLIGFIIVGILAIKSYSELMKLQNNINDTYMILDIYFKKRWNIITSFIAHIDEYIVEDKNLINELKDLHSDVYEGLSMKRKFALNSNLSNNLEKLMEQCLNIEELKNDDIFVNECEQIKQVEKRINECRQNYNDAVKNFDIQIEKFPNYIIGGMMNLREYIKCD